MLSTVDRKQDILKAALGLILTEGAAALTIRKVADAAGISTGLVIYHFESKEKLIGQAWRTAVLDLGDRIDAETSPGFGREWMETTFRVRFRERDEASVPGLLWLEYWAYLARMPDLCKEHSRSYGEWQQVELSRLEEAFAEGELRSDLDPTLIIDMLHTMVCGLVVKSAVDAEVITPERAFEIGRFFLSLISARGPGD
jgi:AcrR family transcriptional regulator